VGNKRQRRGRKERKRKAENKQQSRNVTNSIHGAAGNNLRSEKATASPSIRRIWAVTCILCEGAKRARVWLATV